MKNVTFSFPKLSQTAVLGLVLLQAFSLNSYGQISFNDDSHAKADSRKIRREAARYKADDVKDSHLNMANYSYKKGEPGRHAQSEEITSDAIYNGPNPIESERRFFKKKR